MKTILVPLDGSALAEQVLPSVRMLAPILGANVKLLHVALEINRYHLAMEREPGDAFATQRDQHLNAWDTLRQNAENYLEHQVTRLGAAGVQTVGEVRLGAGGDNS